MIYSHMVKKDGVYYKAGEDVPEKRAAGVPLPFSDDEIIFETREDRKYTKTEINRMTTEELQELAAENGVEGAHGMTGGELKKILIQKFNL